MTDAEQLLGLPGAYVDHNAKSPWPYSVWFNGEILGMGDTESEALEAAQDVLADQSKFSD